MTTYDVTVDVMSYPHVCWQRSTKLSTTYANVWTCAFLRVLDIMWTRLSRL